MQKRKDRKPVSAPLSVSTSNKVISIEQLADVVAKLQKEGKTVVHCHGCFDLMHPGHILYFEAARKEGDVLIVTLTEDKHVNKGPGRPVFNHHVRAKTLSSLEVVDYVAINPYATAVETILAVRPNVYVKGSEFVEEAETTSTAVGKEREAVESIGGRMHFTYEPIFSSSELLNRHFNTLPTEVKTFIDAFRKKYSGNDVTAWLKKLSNLKVLVIGETIIDEYHYCAPMGKSAKESIVASKFLREEAFAGGILACANHVSGFVKNVKMVSGLGPNEPREDFVRRHLKENISPQFVYHETAPTVVKRRYVWDPFLVKLFEVVFLDERPISEKTEKEVVKILDKELSKYDLVIVTDYGHGFFTPAIIKKLTQKAKFLAVNTQTNSANTGYNLITKYPRADYVCIDEVEMRLAHHDKFGDLKNLVKKTAKMLKSKSVTVTRGHLGSLVWSAGNGFAETPVLSKEIVDRVGAGDAFLAVTSPCVALGFPADLVGFIGNAVGALAVRIVGNRSATEPAQLVKFMTTLLK